MPGLPVHRQLPSLFNLMSIESVMPSSNLILCHPLLLLPSIFLSIRIFLRSQFFASGAQSIGASASTSVLPLNIQDWYPLGWTGWIYLQSKGLSRVSPTTQFKSIIFSALNLLYVPTLISIHGYWKNQALTRWTFVDKVMSLLFNMLSRFVIAFLPRGKCLLIWWLQSPSAVIMEPPKIKSVTVSILSLSICHEVMRLDAMIFIFECLVLSQLFHSPLSLSSRGSSVSVCFLP